MTQCEIGKIGWLEPNILLVDIEERTEIGVEHMYEFNDIAQSSRIMSSASILLIMVLTACPQKKRESPCRSRFGTIYTCKTYA